MYSPTRQLRHRLITGALVVAVVVGYDRILLGVHYPSDVVGGLLLGATTTLLGLAVFDPLPRGTGKHRTNIAP
jgi:membrane-associated phospholipid phosphatase